LPAVCIIPRVIPRAPTDDPQPTRRRGWAFAKQVFKWLLLLGIVGLLAVHADDIDWAGVGRSLAGYSGGSLAMAACYTACAYAVYSCFDLLARRYTHTHLPARTVMTITFISHSLGLNLGFAGVALRFRLYGAFGIDSGTVARIWGLSVMTNWLGFLLLAGVLFAGRFIDTSAGSTVSLVVGAAALQSLGVAFLAATALYLLLCTVAHGRALSVFGQQIFVPKPAIALLQLLLSVANWSLMASVLHVLLRGQIDYPTVLGVLLTSALALAVADVPGGLGVTEAVFVALLGSRIALADLLAALVVYRAVFYLLPLGPALLAYLAIEWRQRTRQA
jgi:uncharacterized membrane protein YbhN (UPF0104 family)